MNILVLPPALRAQIIGEAVAARPRECCGLIEGLRRGESIAATALHPARNLAEREDRFEIDPAAHIRLLKAARAAGHTIVGCYHSHPGGEAQPSPRDLEGASEADFVWLIASIDRGANPKVNAFLFNGVRFEALRLVHEDDP